MTPEMTPQRILRRWLLTTLGQKGGSLSTQQAYREMERYYGVRLTDEDHRLILNGKEPKWHNRTRFERKAMERDGLLVPATQQRGQWTLTDAGWREYRELRDLSAAARIATTGEEREFSSVPAPRRPEGSESPARTERTTQRVVRSTAVADYVKKLHDYTCQVCGTQLLTPRGTYAEAAHIQALGRPHEGPDIPANVLCLCPNHHVLFDYGMLTVEDDLTVLDHATGTRLERLREDPDHAIDPLFLAHHRAHSEKLREAATS
ncbi:HNH endonuclease [Streptomyces sp. MJP52]|uniref:HNH endonuclease n=1 Tax=Streptomyces sp. MJP52 TaxID=2940555 RepID=UPI002474BBC8|nr:HNH endonuclease [Streptomyces sp. MJP52]MDH6228162.1 hypothetical protein [Streptomyces sp. MJP52]